MREYYVDVGKLRLLNAAKRLEQLTWRTSVLTPPAGLTKIVRIHEPRSGVRYTIARSASGEYFVLVGDCRNPERGAFRVSEEALKWALRDTVAF